MKLKQTIQDNLPLVAVLVVTFAVYLQTYFFGFADFDDDLYVRSNPYIQKGLTLESIMWALSATYQATWQPLVWISFMADFSLFGLKPGGYHITNLIYHLIATTLLYAVMFKATGKKWHSLFVASVFALHPLHVESVAWIAERKDTLSALFWFLTMFLYLRYIDNKTKTNYGLMTLSLALGLMSKGMLVTLPFVLVLFDYWPLKRFDLTLKGLKSSVLEKLPLFALIIVSTVATSNALKSWGALATPDELGLLFKIANAIVSYFDYILMTLYPANLAVFYPHPGETISLLKVALCGLILLLITLAVIYKTKSHRYLTVGWFWFLGVLFPTIGIAQIGGQALADRYMYIPIVGLAIIVAWLASELVEKYGPEKNRKTILITLFSLTLILMTGTTYFQTKVWKNSFTLFSHALKVTEGNYLAHNNLGINFLHLSKFDKALFHFKEAVKFNPGYGEAMGNIGRVYEKQGQTELAIKQYILTISSFPTAETHNNLGGIYLLKNKTKKALEQFDKALILKPTLSEVYYNQGIAYLQLNQLAKALLKYKKYLSIHTGKKGLIDGHMNIAFTYYKLNKPVLAIAHFEWVLDADPNNKEAQKNISLLKQSLSRQK